MEVSLEKERIPLGLIYKETKPTYSDGLAKRRQEARQEGTPSFGELTDLFVPEFGPPHHVAITDDV